MLPCFVVKISVSGLEVESDFAMTPALVSSDDGGGGCLVVGFRMFLLTLSLFCSILCRCATSFSALRTKSCISCSLSLHVATVWSAINTSNTITMGERINTTSPQPPPADVRFFLLVVDVFDNNNSNNVVVIVVVDDYYYW